MSDVKTPTPGTKSAKVWSIASSMEGARRRDVLNACTADGINPYTAATQYQAWLHRNDVTVEA